MWLNQKSPLKMLEDFDKLLILMNHLYTFYKQMKKFRGLSNFFDVFQMISNRG